MGLGSESVNSLHLKLTLCPPHVLFVRRLDAYYLIIRVILTQVVWQQERNFQANHPPAAILLALLPLEGLLSLAPAQTAISNLQPRTDDRGWIVDCHDGQLVKSDARYYLYGTHYGKTDDLGGANYFVWYSSPDLKTWHEEGELISHAQLPGWAGTTLRFRRTWCTTPPPESTCFSTTGGPFPTRLRRAT